MNSFSEAIGSMSGDSTFSIYDVISTACSFDNIIVPSNTVEALLKGKLATISLTDAMYVMAIKDIINAHIVDNAGYNISYAMLDDMCSIFKKYLGGAYVTSASCSKQTILETLSEVRQMTNVHDAAARYFYAITHNNACGSCSGSIGYLFSQVHIYRQTGKIMIINDADVALLQRAAVMPKYDDAMEKFNKLAMYPTKVRN